MENEVLIENVEPESNEQASQSGVNPNVNPSPAWDSDAPLTPGDERTWAMLAHLSVLLNLVTGFLGVGAALLIYFLFQKRSRYVAYQAMQAFLFQLIFWAGGGVLIGATWAVTGALIPIFIGLLLLPMAIVLTLVFVAMPLGALIYGVIGAVQASSGEDFRYWLVGDWARNLI